MNIDELIEKIKSAEERFVLSQNLDIYTDDEKDLIFDAINENKSIRELSLPF